MDITTLTELLADNVPTIQHADGDAFGGVLHFSEITEVKDLLTVIEREVPGLRPRAEADGSNVAVVVNFFTSSMMARIISEEGMDNGAVGPCQSLVALDEFDDENGYHIRLADDWESEIAATSPADFREQVRRWKAAVGL